MIEQIYKFECEGCRICCSNERLGDVVGKLLSKDELKKIVFLREELFELFYIKKDDKYFISPFCKNYDEVAGRCKIYDKRPPECVLYPFIVFRRGNGIIVAIDNECPKSKKFLKDLDKGKKEAVFQIKNIEENIRYYPYLIYDEYMMKVFDFTVIAELPQVELD